MEHRKIGAEQRRVPRALLYVSVHLEYSGSDGGPFASMAFGGDVTSEYVTRINASGGFVLRQR